MEGRVVQVTIQDIVTKKRKKASIKSSPNLKTLKKQIIKLFPQYNNPDLDKVILRYQEKEDDTMEQVADDPEAFKEALAKSRIRIIHLQYDDEDEEEEEEEEEPVRKIKLKCEINN